MTAFLNANGISTHYWRLGYPLQTIRAINDCKLAPLRQASLLSRRAMRGFVSCSRSRVELSQIRDEAIGLRALLIVLNPLLSPAMSRTKCDAVPLSISTGNENSGRAQ